MLSKEIEYEVTKQGHFWPEYVLLYQVRRPGLRKYIIGTEQKRVGAWTFYLDFANTGKRRLIVFLEPRQGEPTLHFRDGEDGSVPTTVEFTLPKTFPGRTWHTAVSGLGRYDIEIVCWTEWKRNYTASLGWKWRLRNWKARVAAKFTKEPND